MSKTIEVDQRGITLRDAKADYLIFWKDIYNINFYRYDCITYKVDCLCIDFEYGEFIEIFSDMIGWNNLIYNMKRFLPLNNEKWYNSLESDEDIVEVYRRQA